MTGLVLAQVHELDIGDNSRIIKTWTQQYVESGKNATYRIAIENGKTGVRRVLIRGLGPSLGVANNLQKPKLALLSNEGAVIATNDNWKQLPDVLRKQIINRELNPGSDNESAMIVWLEPGWYDVVLHGADGEAGRGKIEVVEF